MTNGDRPTERVQVVVIGGGQSGLTVARCLSSRGISHVILEAHARVGDTWRRRWDSLRLFSPAHAAAIGRTSLGPLVRAVTERPVGGDAARGQGI
jgi:cation diffusion facilitator CzcD-associated flavoprotein CzcO